MSRHRIVVITVEDLAAIIIAAGCLAAGFTVGGMLAAYLTLT